MEEGSCVRKMIHIVSIACLVASRMWLGSDCCPTSESEAPCCCLHGLSLWLGFFLSLFFFFPKESKAQPCFSSMMSPGRYWAA